MSGFEGTLYYSVVTDIVTLFVILEPELQAEIF